MIIGVPKEIKEDETRVAITPAGAAELVKDGHTVLIETDAGAGSRITDDQYKTAGAGIVPTAADAWSADLVVKVKEPIAREYLLFRREQSLFCFLHLAADPELAEALMGAGVAAIGYETVEDEDTRLPLLAPMSEVAGRLAPQVGARFLERPNGGRGVLLGGVAGVPPARVGVLGGGIVGNNAALIALGMEASVTILDTDLDRLRYLEEIHVGRIATRMSNTLNIAEVAAESDLLIGAVLTPGARAPKLVSKAMVETMKPGSVIVDVAIDQGGCVETSRPTTHSRPIRLVDEVLHYGVTNIPSAVPHTSTYALTNSTLPWVAQLAGRGWRRACRENRALLKGLNVAAGRLVHASVAQALDLPVQPVAQLLEET